jgi:hypothetical protein
LVYADLAEVVVGHDPFADLVAEEVVVVQHFFQLALEATEGGLGETGQEFYQAEAAMGVELA